MPTDHVPHVPFARTEFDADPAAHPDAQHPPAIAVGDLVRVFTADGVEQFKYPVRVRLVSDCGKYAYVEGCDGSWPIPQMQRVGAKPTPAADAPANDNEKKPRFGKVPEVVARNPEARGGVLTFLAYRSGYAGNWVTHIPALKKLVRKGRSGFGDRSANRAIEGARRLGCLTRYQPPPTTAGKYEKWSRI